MLDKAVAAVKADKAKALQQFGKGEGGFQDRDLYPFCAGPEWDVHRPSDAGGTKT